MFAKTEYAIIPPNEKMPTMSLKHGFWTNSFSFPPFMLPPLLWFETVLLQFDKFVVEVPIKEPSFEMETTFTSSYILHRLQKTPTRAKSMPYRILGKSDNFNSFIQKIMCLKYCTSTLSAIYNLIKKCTCNDPTSTFSTIHQYRHQSLQIMLSKDVSQIFFRKIPEKL